MIPVAPKKTKEINKFVYVPIPTPRDLFSRYGARSGNDGCYLSDPDSLNPVAPCSTTIQSMIRAQRIAENDLQSNQNH